jgi:2-polyprenyl-3-methyl-5-hydroxy-6-metoxy-1,4-benzoquinol methylase
MSTIELDPTRIEAFAGRIVGIINDSMISLALSIGHQTGLFDTMAGLDPATAPEIASAGGLEERYVREILGTLVTGGIVEYDAETATYALPGEHAAVLVRAAGVNNLASMAQFTALLGAVEQDVVRCFREGGGVPYARFPTFHRLMAENTRDTVDATLLDGTLPLVPGLRERLETGIDVADVGCGSGYALNVLARAFPTSRFTGFDFSEEAIGAATAEAAAWGLTNVAFHVQDVTDLGRTEAFDLITTFDAIHDQADPAAVLAGIAAALRADGTYLCIDIAASSHLHENLEHPLAPMLYTISTMHCMTVSLALGGAGLGTCWGEQTALRMLGEAGFTDVRTEHVEGDIFNVYYVARKGG